MKRPSANKVLATFGFGIVWLLCFALPLAFYGTFIKHFPEMIVITLFPFSFLCYLLWKFVFWLCTKYKEIK